MNQNCQAQQAELALKPIPRINQFDSRAEKKLPLRDLFETEETPLLRYAYSLVGRRAVAEEIVQDVFLQLHARWDQIDSPRAWLYRSVRNRAYNHNRDHQREILSSDDQHVPSTHATDGAAETLVLNIETTGNLRLLVEQLCEEDRQLVKLKYFENLKYREISDRTGLSISNVGYRLHHILKGLAEKLRHLGIDELS